MKLRWMKALSAFFALIVLTAVSAFSQEAESASTPAAEMAAPAPVSDISTQAKEIAIYGEVQSVDAQAKTISIQYYDYDSDSEKTAEIAAAGDTKLENISAIGEVKKGDWADVTYIVKDGKNAAKVITVEKEELPAAENISARAPAPTSIPQEE